MRHPWVGATSRGAVLLCLALPRVSRATQCIYAPIETLGSDNRVQFDTVQCRIQELGRLTACPTNVGTGLRMSILIHLPALVLTEDMERVTRGLTEMAFTVRGFYGEGTHPVGNLFQVSNQSTLGVEEGKIVEKLTAITQQIIACEKDAQDALLKEARAQVEDKVWRAYGLLSHARVLSSQEFMNLLSAVRLGYSLGLLKQLDSAFMNRLMIVTQPSHLQMGNGGEIAAEERDIYRAKRVRSHFTTLASEEGGQS